MSGKGSLMRRWLRFVIGTGVAAGAVLLALARYSPAERNARAAWSALTLISSWTPTGLR